MVVVRVVALGLVGVASARLSPWGVAALRGGAAPVTFVGADGASKAGALASAAEEIAAIRGVVVAYGAAGSGKLVDTAFGTSLAALEAGALVDGAVADDCVLLHCSPAVGAAASAAFAAKCADVVLLSTWGDDAAAAIDAVRQVAAAVAAADDNDDDDERPALVVALHDAVSEEGLVRDLEEGASSKFRSVTVLALPHASFEAEAYAAACAGLRDRVRSFVGASAPRTAEAVASSLEGAWVAAGYGGEALIARYVCDVAAADLEAAAATQMAAWRRAFEARGAAPKGWAAEAAELLADSVAAYDAQTVRFSQHSDRLAKRASLKAAVTEGVARLQAEAVDAAAKKHLKRLRRALMKAAALAPDGVVPADRADKATRDAEFDFDLEVTRTELADAPFDLPLADARRAFAEDARQLAVDFPSSTAARLLAAKAETRNAQRETKAARREAQVSTRKAHKQPKKNRSIACAVQLVAMLRPRGFGNLQGFGSYALGPHSLLFGYANDRDMANGDMASMDDQPLLRLQPKLNFDLDV